MQWRSADNMTSCIYTFSHHLQKCRQHDQLHLHLQSSLTEVQTTRPTASTPSVITYRSADNMTSCIYTFSHHLQKCRQHDQLHLHLQSSLTEVQTTRPAASTPSVITYRSADNTTSCIYTFSHHLQKCRQHDQLHLHLQSSLTEVQTT